MEAVTTPQLIALILPHIAALACLVAYIVEYRRAARYMKYLTIIYAHAAMLEDKLKRNTPRASNGRFMKVEK